jgi:hypothetical protein
MMLHELEDEVHSQNEEGANLQWENSDESDEERKENSTITSAQTKLAKELIKLANRYKVPELTFTDKARACQSAYQTWFNKLCQILAIFKETSTLIQREKITPFKDIDCIGNKAVFLLIGSQVDAYFQRAIRKFEGKGDQAMIFIKNQCASTTADDMHHFHHLFTSLQIKENENAMNFFRRFTFAQTEAEGVENTHQVASLVNFALASLVTSKNPKYDIAVQLFNLERDGGKTYTLEDIEEKFFAIDKKISCEAASVRITQGNMATSQRGDRNRRSTRHPHRNGHPKPDDAEKANAAVDSNCYANTTCYNCGKKGHIVPNCPEKKKGKSEHKNTMTRTAQGNVARSTEEALDSPEHVCLARHVRLPVIKPPGNESPVLITVDFHARALTNNRIFVSLAVRVDKSVIIWEQERAFEWYHLPETYDGDIEPMEEPLWGLLHNRPLHGREPHFARITYPDHRAQTVFTKGIIPGLKRGINIEPRDYPKCFRFWHSLVQAYLEFWQENIEQGLNLPVTIGISNRTVVISFYPVGYAAPSIISMGDMEYFTHPDDSDDEYDQAFTAISKTESANIVRKRDPSIAERGYQADLNNYLPNSGATQHMTPHLADLVEAVEGQNLGVEVADGHVIKCTTTGKIKIRMLDDNGTNLEVTLTDVMYIPGLSRCLFSVSKFACHGFHTMIKKNVTTLYF